MIDAGAMVDAALALRDSRGETRHVGPQLVERFQPVNPVQSNGLMATGSYEIEFLVGGSDNEIRHLEHVEVVGNIKLFKRGCLEAYITSPFGTESKVMRVGFTTCPTWAS